MPCAKMRNGEASKGVSKTDFLPVSLLLESRTKAVLPGAAFLSIPSKLLRGRRSPGLGGSLAGEVVQMKKGRLAGRPR